MARAATRQKLVGLLTPRERVWQAIRLLRTFTASELHAATKPAVRLETCKGYLKHLEKFGYLTGTGVGRNENFRFREAVYTLCKDSFEAPRVSSTGEKVTMGMQMLAMWRAMKALKEFDYVDIRVASSAGDFQVNPTSAKLYVNALARAGYFRTVQPAQRGPRGTPARYRLVKDTGARAPAITRVKTVLDRNTGEVILQQSAQEVCDELE